MLGQLMSAIEARTARVGVVGLGYVGLPLILRLAQAGFPVSGFDINRDLLRQIGHGASPFSHIPDADLSVLDRETTILTDEFEAARDLDAVLICLPTPLDRYRQPDLGYVVRSVEALAPHLTPQTLVSLESTSWPGTTEEMLAPILLAHGLEPGHNIALVFSPERGSRQQGLHHPPDPQDRGRRDAGMSRGGRSSIRRHRGQRRACEFHADGTQHSAGKAPWPSRLRPRK